MKIPNFDLFKHNFKSPKKKFALQFLCTREFRMYVDGFGGCVNKCVCCPFNWVDSIKNCAVNFQTSYHPYPVEAILFDSIFSGSHRRFYSLDFETEWDQAGLKMHENDILRSKLSGNNRWLHYSSPGNNRMFKYRLFFLSPLNRCTVRDNHLRWVCDCGACALHTINHHHHRRHHHHYQQQLHHQ